MLKKTIKYTDYNDNQREETFYFNLSKAELSEMQLSAQGGLESFIRRIIEEQNVPEIIKILKEIILKSYGEKSDDGKVFLKSPEISHRFECTEAYSELFMDIASSPENAINFINGILPEEIRKQIKEESAKQSANA